MKAKKQLIDFEHKGNEKHHSKLRPALLSLCMLTFIGGYSQTGQVNLNLKNATVKELFREIEKQTSYRFSYRDIEINNKGGITISGQGKELKEVLTNELAKQQLSYTISGNKIIVSPVKNEAVSTKEKKVTGKVVDAMGEPVISATVKEIGTNNGIVTDIDGNFSLAVQPDASLEISFVGYKTEIVKAVDGKSLVVRLKEDNELLDEVVVVGYGTMKKVNLTGAVSTVKVDETLTNRSLTNVSSALTGLVPGLSAVQSSGMAGNSNASLKIRGLGTVNNSDPLIVVDGMPDVDINRLNVNDIESVSVLKDATSSAIYGSRAANGVILITTKSGKRMDKTRISLTGSYAFVKPTDKVADFMADYPRALTVHQRAAMNGGTSRDMLRYKDGTIDEWMAKGMIDPISYPNTDWWDYIMRTGAIQNYNLSISGGNEKSNFYISAGVMDNKGIQINNDYRRYNARLNYDYNLAHNMKVGVRVAVDASNMSYYLSDGFTGSNESDIILQTAIAGIYPYDPTLNKWGGVMAYGEDIYAYNPYAAMMNQVRKRERHEANGSIYLEWEPIKGLKARADFSLNYFNQFNKSADMPTGYAYNFQTGEDVKREYVTANAPISNSISNGYKTLTSAQLNYNTTIAANHDISALMVYSEEYWFARGLSASRQDRIHPSLGEIDAALPELQTTGGNSSAEGLRSFVGRINYSAYDKYLLELNFRCDGSSKFLPGHRYGFFPSGSLGWRFTEEDFFKPIFKGWLTSGKLRLSYGSLGNNSGVGRYEQQETLAKKNYMINGKVVNGFVNTKMVNQELSWETTKVFNIGVDLGFFDNRLTAELDYYDRFTTGMNRPSELSVHFGGFNPPRKNIGDLRNRGIELNLTWNDRVNDWNYRFNANFSYNRNRLEKWNEFLSRGSTFLDMPYGFLYTYEAVGIAQTWGDILQSTPQGAAPGDILFKDLNGDGRIDDKDKKAFPNVQTGRPTMNFAFSGSVTYKGFDLSALFEGAAGRKNMWLNCYNQVNILEFRYASTWNHWNNPWTVENRDGAWPRMQGTARNQSGSTFWLDNMAYLRMKNLQFGYTVPKKFLSKCGLSGLRLFVSGENLFTITSYRGLDPEKQGNVDDAYPINRTFSIGLNLDI